METIVRTVSGALLQTSQLLGTPLTIGPNSTLNQKFDIHTSVGIPNNAKPITKYIAIGNGGHTMGIGPNNLTYIKSIQHTPRHAALYNHLPFVLRLPANDLSPAEVTKYRLRTTIAVGGVQYVAYYLKVLDLTDSLPQLELRTVTNGVSVPTPFQHTVSDLNPTPPQLPNTGTITTDGDYIAASAKVTFDMGPSEIDEFLNVCNIIYNDINYATISELALCSGIDVAVNGNFKGVSLSYTEAIAVQCVSFMEAEYVAKHANLGIKTIFDIGSLEPMLNLT